jgi:hypothetical protein
MILENQFLDKLNLDYEQAQAASEPDVLSLEVYKIIKEYKLNNALSNIPQLIRVQEDNELSRLRTLNGQGKQECKLVVSKVEEHLDCYYKKLRLTNRRDYIITHALEEEFHPHILKLIRNVKDFKTLEHTAPENLQVWNLTVKQMLFNLYQYAYVNRHEIILAFLSQILVTSVSGEIISYEFNPSFKAWDDENKKILNIQKTHVGYAWAQLTRLYEMFKSGLLLQKNEMPLYKSYLATVYGFTREKLLFQQPVQHLLPSEQYDDRSKEVLNNKDVAKKIKKKSHTNILTMQKTSIGRTFKYGEIPPLDFTNHSKRTKLADLVSILRTDLISVAS